MTEKKAYLTLENGMTFEGYRFGSDRDAVGELVFTTGVCGYLETLTDPAYYGQMVIQTFPLIGNYGVIPADFQGACALSAYIVREQCTTPSNFRAEKTLDEALKERGIPGLYGVDTRQLTRIIREAGVMNAQISDAPVTDLSKIKGYQVTGGVAEVTNKDTESFGDQNAPLHAVVWNFGAGQDVKEALLSRNVRVTVLPASIKAEDILKYKPDGILLSGGPGDPAENTAVIAEVAKVLGRVPALGIGLGHQLMALATGGQTVKMKHGHRGANQPSKDHVSGRTYMTTQNHGYAVDGEKIKTGKLRFVNVNDGTVEGIDYPEQKAFSVQFYPEVCGGNHGTSFLYDRFVTMMKEGAYAD